MTLVEHSSSQHDISGRRGLPPITRGKSQGVSPLTPLIRLSGGRTWWAQFEFARINIAPTILRKKIEEFREAGATLLNAAAFIGVTSR